MAQFCPKCYYPLDESDDDGRLCSVCRWFGDKSEVCSNPPPSTDLTLAFTQLLAMYREICRLELLAEQLTDGHSEYAHALTALKVRSSHARHSILYLFQETGGRDKGDENDDDEQLESA